MGSLVKLYVYDVTRGMARGISMSLLGRQLDGVWHTGIVVYGKEYFYGNGGITFVPVGNFMLGPPDQIIELGHTEIPEELFNEYIHDVSHSSFAGYKYHLLNNNCNTFSNEVASFLTGNTIPENITNLPMEVMNTPFGQMLRPLIDSMMNQFNQGTHMDDENSTDYSTATTRVNTASGGIRSNAGPAIPNSTAFAAANNLASVGTGTNTVSAAANPGSNVDSMVIDNSASQGSNAETKRSSAASAPNQSSKEHEFELD